MKTDSFEKVAAVPELKSKSQATFGCTVQACECIAEFGLRST